jgi:hypothetical protein
MVLTARVTCVERTQIESAVSIDNYFRFHYNLLFAFNMSLLYQRARNSGLCAPSLLIEECSAFDSLDGFDVAMYHVIDANGTFVVACPSSVFAAAEYRSSCI